MFWGLRWTVWADLGDRQHHGGAAVELPGCRSGWRRDIGQAFQKVVQGVLAVIEGAAVGGHRHRNAGVGQIVPGGDCQCASGGKFSFWERQADPTRVVLFLNG
jgi:hypothetical protein